MYAIEQHYDSVAMFYEHCLHVGSIGGEVMTPEVREEIEKRVSAIRGT